jgi:hypothetical protein
MDFPTAVTYILSYLVTFIRQRGKKENNPLPILSQASSLIPKFRDVELSGRLGNLMYRSFEILTQQEIVGGFNSSSPEQVEDNIRFKEKLKQSGEVAYISFEGNAEKMNEIEEVSEDWKWGMSAASPGKHSFWETISFPDLPFRTWAVFFGSMSPSPHPYLPRCL